MLFLSVLPFVGAALAACNGYKELCDRKYSNVTFIGTHNSAFDGLSPADNQHKTVVEQLDFGVRFLQAQTHDKDGTIQLCHTYCELLDAGTLENYLQSISYWMGNNTDEVVTLLLTNRDAIDVNKYAEVFDKTGLRDYALSPKGHIDLDDWPTMGELIDKGTRLIVFMDYHADESKVDYIIDEFNYFWETPYGVTNSSFPTCEVDRPDNGDPKKLMGMMNHMLNLDILGIVVPDREKSDETNSKDSIQDQVDLCISEWNKTPNVVLVDWVNDGACMEVQKTLNGLS